MTQIECVKLFWEGIQMKKVLSALLSSAIIVSNVSALPLNTNAAWKGQYEFEKGKIVNSGENSAEIMSVSGASGKYPAIRGLDYMGDDFSGRNHRAIDWYKKE